MTDAELDGLSVVMANVVKAATAPLLRRIEVLEQERPRDGKDGVDGKDAAVDIPAIVAEVLKAIPAPKDGRDGIDGKDGKDAEPVDVETLAKAAAALVPVPRDGRDGIPGAPGRDGKDGEKGGDGRDGKDGADGLGFDDLIVESDGERRFEVKCVRGDRVKAFGALVIPAQIYRGVWQAGRAYERGDTATWAGSLWHANETTCDKPGDGSKAWTLCVKKGADGKVGPEGKAGPQGPMGPQGPQGPKVY